ncbi:MAG: LuxR C-terminal-related transcriptional regulator [Oscillospiraceae bacterium]|jgi:DNA-binding CsgD family transcriptional regulator|nr:LuxR C-terminal-related transcriptional regulator [Oscillospiraceae bacterium]
MKKRAIATLSLIALLLAAVTVQPSAFASGQIQAGVVFTRRDFTRALGDKQSVIYVDDVDFGENGGRIIIENDVTIIGREGGSTFTEAHFDIIGGSLPEDTITVRFENIIFDGGYDTASVVLPPEGLGFRELFGERHYEEYGAVYNDGYTDMSFLGCDFTRYVAFTAPVAYVEWRSASDDDQKRAALRMDSCKVYGNISEKGTVSVNGANTSVRVTNSRFYENTARSAAGLFLQRCDEVEIIDCMIYDNRHYIFNSDAQENISNSAFYGGGLFVSNSELRLIRTRIENNRADWGGGLFINNSAAWIDDCRIAANQADMDGGGLFIYSLETCPVYITNTLIAVNRAARGGAFFVTLADLRERVRPAGLLEVSFSTIGCNEADDGSRFMFDDTMTVNGTRGEHHFFGCFIVDDSLPGQLAKTPDYSYITSAEDAVRRSAAPREQVNQPLYIGLRPTPGGEADVTVPAEAMKLWAQGAYAAIEYGRKIGWQGLAVGAEPASSPDPSEPLVSPEPRRLEAPEEHGGFNPLILIIPAAFLLCVAGVVYLFVRRRKAAALPAEDTAADSGAGMIKENGNGATDTPVFVAEKLETFRQAISTLTRTQRDVFDQLAKGYSTNEIADILTISVNTVRKHNAAIREKLGVKSLDEMMVYIRWMNKGGGDEKQEP